MMLVLTQCELIKVHQLNYCENCCACNITLSVLGGRSLVGKKERERENTFFFMCLLTLSSLGLFEGWERWGGCFLCEQLQWGSYCCCWWCLWVWDRIFYYWMIKFNFQCLNCIFQLWTVNKSVDWWISCISLFSFEKNHMDMNKWLIRSWQICLGLWCIKESTHVSVFSVLIQQKFLEFWICDCWLLILCLPGGLSRMWILHYSLRNWWLMLQI